MHSPLTNAGNGLRFMDMHQQDHDMPPEPTVFEIHGDLSTPEKQKALVEAISKAHKAFLDLGTSAGSSGMDMEALRASCAVLEAVSPRIPWYRRLVRWVRGLL